MRWRTGLVILAVTCVLGGGLSVIGKAWSVWRYRAQVAALYRTGDLPSQTFARVQAAVLGSRPANAAAARSVLSAFGPVRNVRARDRMRTEVGVEVGDEDRLGWSYRITFFDTGQSSGGGYSNQAALSPLLGVPNGIETFRHGACWVAGVLALLLVCAAAAEWRWHRPIAAVGVAASAAASVLAVVAAEADQLWVDRDALIRSWPTLLLLAVSLGIASVPTRRPIGGHRCHRCRYDLTGNVTGTCPECGMKRRRSGPLRG